jgi:ribose 1,5-bisphosphokinase PhnN
VFKRKMRNDLRNKWQQEKIILIDDNDDLILVGERINSAERYKRERHEEIPERLERNENSCFDQK